MLNLQLYYIYIYIYAVTYIFFYFFQNNIMPFLKNIDNSSFLLKVTTLPLKYPPRSRFI